MNVVAEKADNLTIINNNNRQQHHYRFVIVSILLLAVVVLFIATGTLLHAQYMVGSISAQYYVGNTFGLFQVGNGNPYVPPSPSSIPYTGLSDVVRITPLLIWVLCFVVFFALQIPNVKKALTYQPLNFVLLGCSFLFLAIALLMFLVSLGFFDWLLVVVG